MQIQGWASTPHLDSYHHVMQPGSLAESIRRRGITGPRGVKLLAYHDSTKPAGSITKLEYREGGLWIEAELETGISYANDIALASKAAGGLSFSIGFFLMDADIEEGPDGREYLLITKGDLFEVSVVVFPANEFCAFDTKGNEADPLDKLLATLSKAKVAVAELQSKAKREPASVDTVRANIRKLKEAMK